MPRENDLTASRIFLEISKLKMRVLLLQGLVLRNDVALRLCEPASQTLSEAIHGSLSVLEETASFVEGIFLSDPAFRQLDDAERALYADEFREMVESMKSYVTRLAEGKNG